MEKQKLNSLELSFKEIKDLNEFQVFQEAKEVLGYLSTIREGALNRGQCVVELDLRIRQMKHVVELFEDALKP